jgi:D-psicose/D-tagatose/L-ribulose 3-epimerase
VAASRAIACHLNVVAPDLERPGLEPALDLLAGLGYSHVVLPPIDPGDPRLGEWAAVFRDRGLTPVPLCGQGPGADVSSEDADERRAGEDALRAFVEATVALGGDQLNGVPYGPFGRAAAVPGTTALARSAEAVGRVADHAGERGVVMTFEVLNRYETAMITTAAEARVYAELSGSSNLRVHLDTFHMAVEEADMLAAVRETAPVLGYLELGQSGRGSLATGVVDVPAVLRAADEAGYTGLVGYEAFTRSVLTGPATGALAIWRDVYADGATAAREAIDIIRGAQQPALP